MNILEQKFCTHEEVISFPMGKETILIPAENNIAELNQAILSNSAAFEFWKSLDAGQTPLEICQGWSERYSIDLEELKEAALELVFILKPILKIDENEDEG